MSFEYLQGGKLHNLFRQPAPVIHFLVVHTEQKTFCAFSPREVIADLAVAVESLSDG